jgi:hypothetical protein
MRDDAIGARDRERHCSFSNARRVDLFVRAHFRLAGIVTRHVDELPAASLRPYQQLRRAATHTALTARPAFGQRLEDSMLRYVKLVSAGCVCALVSTVPLGAARNTANVTFEEPVRVAGKILAPGTYALEQVASQIISVSKDGHFVTLATGVPATRSTIGRTAVTLHKAAAGAPSDLAEWFFDGAPFGVAFESDSAGAQPSLAKSLAAKPCVGVGAQPE